jgi:hypothetical protein
LSPDRDRWSGIQCTPEGNVKSIELNVKDISGTIPACIGKLAHLEKLYLFANMLS